MCVKNAGEANCEGIREIEALRHLRTEIVAHLATFWEATGASDCLLRRTAGFVGFATTRTDSAHFSIKGRLPELLFTQVCLTFRVAGAHASCFGLHLRSPLRAAAITHRKNRVRSTSMFPFLDYAPTERADDPKITLSAPALHQRRYRIHSEAWFHCSPSVVSSLERSA